ncbi:MAG: two pore domain potassium channel family protein [Candidatus Methanomethylophilaceae archaeon]|nr:two pore domain potassium channel family protein [Candidatus Methanomethylophilaceae archaeon]MBP5395065.1 two pore domain potassium channel family protein [Candidatus Methanomethylophilaceae archaeon]
MNRLTLKQLFEHVTIIVRSYRLVHFDRLLLSYLIVYVIASFVVWALDPDVKGISDALWFTFQTGTTIGYGDLIVNNWFARIVTVLFSVYSMALVAVFTGILAGYFVEIIKTEAKDSAVKFLLDLERLPEMSQEELVDLSERAKRFARKEWDA